MAWLRGSTDMANINSDLYSLLTGAIAASNRGSGQAGNGVTVPAADAWVGLDATNHMLRPPTTGVNAVTMKPWRLPIACWRGMPRFGWTSGTMPSPANMLIGRPTFTGVYSGGTARVYYKITVNTANTATGNLTGLSVSYTVINVATGATVTGPTAVTGWAGTSDTKLLTTGVSLTLTLNAGETIVTTAQWFRGYSTTYPQGVDFIPEFGRLVTANTINLSTTSAGANAYTLNTDYKVVAQGDDNPNCGAVSVNYTAYDWADCGVFYGIEWQNGASPPATGATYYVVDGDLCGPAVGFATSGSNNFLAIMAAEFWDGTNQKGKNVGNLMTAGTVNFVCSGSPGPPGVQLFTSSTPTSSWFVNYWISVKADKLVLVLRGDPGNAGMTAVLTFQKGTALHTGDTHPWFFSLANAYSLGIYQSFMWEQHVYDKPYWGTSDFGTANSTRDAGWGINNGQSTYGNLLNTALTNVQANPEAFDRKWWLYKLYGVSNRGNKDSGGNYSAIARKGGPRMTVRGIYSLANDNFSHLDELVDGGTTYLLVQATGTMAGSDSNLAILEE